MRSTITVTLATAACLAAAPLAAQDGGDTGAETGGVAETFGIETGPSEFEDIEIDGLSAEALAGSDILGASGDRIGEVADVLIVENGPDKIVLALDGMLGGGTSNLLIPLDEVEVQKNGDETFRVRTTLTEDTIDALAEYDAA